MRPSSVAATSLGLLAAAGGAFLATTSLGRPLIAGAIVFGAAAWFCRRLRVPVVTLGLLVGFAGYTWFNRVFAGLHLPAGPLPLYVGELLLAVALPWALARWPGSPPRDIRRFFILLGLWLAYATLRLLVRGFGDGIETVRDFALAYYALFAVVGYAAWPTIGRAGWNLYFIVLFCVMIPVVALLISGGYFLLPLDPEDPESASVNRADVMAAALLAGATFFLLALRQARFSLARIAAASVSLLLVLPLEVRAATVAAGVLLGVFAMQRRWTMLFGLIGLPVVAYVILNLAGFNLTGRSGSTSPEAIVSRQFATISVLLGGTAVEAADAGQLYTFDPVVDTIAWRFAWWNALLGELTSSAAKFSFGLGFGADLTAPLGYQPGDPNGVPVRSPHNFLLTVFARTGVVGLALWLAMLGAWALVLLRAIRQSTRANRPLEADYLLWLMSYPLAFVITAVFGVVLEGPYGAIPCYLLLGLGLGAAARANAEPVRAPTAVAAHTATARDSRPVLASS